MTPEQESAAREAYIAWAKQWRVEAPTPKQAYLAAWSQQQERIDEKDAALRSIRKAAGSGHSFTNRLQFIHARAGCAIDGLPWDESWKAEQGYHVRDRTMTENDELRQRIDELERQLALMRACVDAADRLRGEGYEPRPGVTKVQAYDAARALIKEQP